MGETTLIGFIKNTSNKGIKFYSKVLESPIDKNVDKNNIKTKEGTIITCSDSSWNDCVDTERSTRDYITFVKGGAVEYGCHLPVTMSSGEAEYIAATVVCMRASHLRMLMYELRNLRSPLYSGDIMDSEPARIIIDNEAATSMAKCDKDTAGNRHVARHYHYIRQRAALKEHIFNWINTKSQVADILTKVGMQAAFNHLWDLVLHKVE